MDIVFAPTLGVSAETGTPGPAKVTTALDGHLYLGRLPQQLWEEVYKACMPRGKEFYPQPQFGQMYAFWNEEPADPSSLDWDPDTRLRTTVAISRLVHPTSLGFEFSARVSVDAEGQIERVVPGAVSGILAQAYVADSRQPNWLTDDNACDIPALLDAFYRQKDELPSRVSRAFWNHEYAASLEWTDLRWTIVATALESLVHTDRGYSTMQFVDRVPALARRVGVSFSCDDAKQAYDLRSELAHGGPLRCLDDPTRTLYCRMEDVLRSCIRTAIQDSTFQHIFRDNDQIRRLG